MLIKFFNLFTKVTGWPVQKILFRTRICYEDKAVQGRSIKGPAILVSNHTSVWDYAIWLFVFPFRTLRFQMAELLFRRPVLGLFLRCMGGIHVDRNAFDFSFITRSARILERGGVVGIFPEGRLPNEGEARPLPFKISAAWLALQTGVTVIPVYTNGAYFCKERAKVIIGVPMRLNDLVDETLPEKEAIAQANEILRKRIMELEGKLHG